MSSLKVVEGGGEAIGKETERAQELHDRAFGLIHEVTDRYWKLSETLQHIYENGLYMKLGYDSWTEYVETKLQFSVRKAQMLVGIYSWFSKMPQPIKDWIISIGWSKANELVGVVTEANAAEWKRKLEGKSVAETKRLLAEQKDDGEGAGGGEGPKDDSAEKPVSMKFKLFGDQNDVVTSAINVAKRRANSDKDGNALTLMATEFLALSSDNGDMAQHLTNLEHVYGFKLVAYDQKNDVVVFGGDTVAMLSADPGEPVDQAE